MKYCLFFVFFRNIHSDELDKVTFDPKNMEHLEVFLEKHTPEKNNSLLFTTLRSKIIIFSHLFLSMIGNLPYFDRSLKFGSTKWLRMYF